MPRQAQLQACYQMASTQRAMQAIRLFWGRHSHWGYQIRLSGTTNLVILATKSGKTKEIQRHPDPPSIKNVATTEWTRMIPEFMNRS